MNKKGLLFSLWAVLVLELLYIFIVLLNYDLPWMNPEKFWTHAWILENGSQLKWEDITRSLNIDVIEVNADRLSRPISNLVEVLDTKFRANCWQWMPPHPSFSLLWPVLFIALPWFLYRFLVNMGCQNPVAFAGTCLYISSIGFLGPIIMLFHPAKSLVNFFAILALWSSSVLYQRRAILKGEYGIKDIPGFWFYFSCSCLALYIGFFSDETGLFVFLMNLAILYFVINQLKEQKIVTSVYFLLPILYWITLKIVLPYIHLKLRGKVIDVAHYESYPQIWTLLLPNVNNLWTNFCWLFADYPHITLSFKNISSCWPYLILQMIYTALLCYVGFLFIAGRKFYKDYKMTSLVLASGGLLIGYVFFQTFQLSVNAKVWGVWWYGSLFSLIFYVAMSFVLQKAWQRGGKFFEKFFVLIVAILVIEGLIFTTYRISIFKHQNLDRNNYTYRRIFNGQINPYTHFDFLDSYQKSQCKRIYSALQWEKYKQKKANITASQIASCQELMVNNIYFPIEMIYLPIELKDKG